MDDAVAGNERLAEAQALFVLGGTPQMMGSICKQSKVG
jgi:hypothetical protein